MIKGWFADLSLRRILKNTSWLLIGRIITGLTGLVYLGVATHSLGVENFGLLILVQTYMTVLAELTTFQSWQAVIRYGSQCVQGGDRRSFQNLLKFTTLLDLGGAVAGVALAIAIAPLLAPYLQWPPEVVRQTQWCSLAILFTLVATPTGLLRLYNRFDLLAFHVTIFPLVRLVGTVIAVVYDAPLWGYLLAWAVGKMVEGLVLLGFGWYQAWKHGTLKGFTLATRGLTNNHPGLWKFCIASNFDSSLPIVMRQSAPLMIGLVGTPTVVGLFRIAYELSTPLMDVAKLFSQSLYPELAKLSVQRDWQPFKQLMGKTTKISSGLGLGFLLIFVVFGRPILFYGFGGEFVPAYGPLLLLVLAEVFTMVSCALEPALYAMGYPGLSLRVNLISILGVYVPSLVIFTGNYGAEGAAIATILSTLSILLLNGAMVWQQLRSAPPAPTPSP